MNFIRSVATTGEIADLHYVDYGHGHPVIFIHGWPLNHQMWEYQLNELPQHGLRCIAYDRRGFGHSTKTWGGYNYDALADDLHAVIEELGLEKVTLVGFSMGGGEVVRYLSRRGSSKVSRVVLISSIIPGLLQSDGSPDGVPIEKINEMETQLREDRPAFLSTFGKAFYGQSMLSHPVSHDILLWSQNLALMGSSRATLQCLQAFSKTDFTDELAAVDVPTLLIHGTADQTVPYSATSHRASQLLPNSRLLTYDGEPHGLFYTARKRLNIDLLDFLNAGTGQNKDAAPVTDEYREAK